MAKLFSLGGIATLLYWMYALVFLVSGVLGMIDVQREMDLLFQVDLREKVPEAASSLLNQYRFLRASEAGFGLFLLLLRSEVWTSRKFNLAFLLAMLAPPVARAISIARDGWPHPAFVLLMIVEFVAYGVFVVHAKRAVWTRKPVPADGAGEREPRQLAAKKADSGGRA